MRTSKWSEEQIIKMLREREVDEGQAEPTPLVQFLKQRGVSKETFSRWRRTDGGMSEPEAMRLKALERENVRLKRLVADQALDIQGLKEIGAQKW